MHSCLLPCACTGVRRPLLEPNSTGQPIDCSTIAQSCVSVSVIAVLGQTESVVSQWTWGSDGNLELPTRPEPGANYFLQVCASDGSHVRVPVRVAACVRDDMQASLEQS